ncbi:MAG: hypothetical protein GY800_08225 [Planctomycetes bacterium]|nr:hypothetical protein [Planctomycetota bacterium]
MKAVSTFMVAGAGGLDNIMKMNLDPGREDTVINVRGPCKVNVTTGDSTVATVEVPPGKVYKLVIKREGKWPEQFLAEEIS